MTSQRQRWKMQARELLAPRLIQGESWNPLDGTLEDYIPDQWSGPHVGMRLIEGFKTLACLPNTGMHRAAMGFWPETWPEWSDRLAQVESDSDTQERDAAERNRVRARPSAQQITYMEIVLMWPAHFLVAHSVFMSRVVQMVAYMRARECEMEYVARKMRMGPRQLRSVNREGLDLIAAGLRRSGEVVF